MAALAIMGATTVLSVLGSRAARQSQNRAILNTLETKGRAFISENEILEQKRDELDRELGDILTTTALEAVKAESSARAMQAGTGVVSGDIDNEARMTQMLEEQQVLAKGKTADIDLLRNQLVNRISFRNESAALVSSMQTGTEAQLGTISAGVAGFKGGLNLLSPQTKAGILA